VGKKVDNISNNGDWSCGYHENNNWVNLVVCWSKKWEMHPMWLLRCCKWREYHGYSQPKRQMISCLQDTGNAWYGPTPGRKIQSTLFRSGVGVQHWLKLSILYWFIPKVPAMLTKRQ